MSRRALVLVVAALLLAAACGTPAGPPGGATAGTTGAGSTASATAVGGAASATAGRGADGDWFRDVTDAVGVQDVHVNGATGAFYYPEILGPGVALVDIDQDGDLDLYLAQGRAMATASETMRRPVAGRLYRNDLVVGPDGARALHFTDITATSGLVVPGYPVGVAAGDIDNDGLPDFYLTGWGASRLFHNEGGGHFTDVTATRGARNGDDFSVSATFVDYDRDGWLDLYVGNNIRYQPDQEHVCPNPAGARDYCPPQVYGPMRDRLFHNDRRGHFTEVTATALRGLTAKPALGVVALDADGDGWTDLYVANDGEENLLWMNQRDGTFREAAITAGAALTAEGKAEASMGVDAGDYDNDGDDDLLMTELTGQGFNLFANDGHGRFRDQGAAAGIGPASLPLTGWGTAWVDVDNDTWLDALAVNGTIIANPAAQADAFPYGQWRALFHNRGQGRFVDASQRLGAARGPMEAGRGAAFGDIDNDGDVDVVVGNDGGRVRVLLNQVGQSAHWLGLRLVGAGAPRDQVGAVVTVSGGGLTHPLRRHAHADGSYASASDPRVLVGLGAAAQPVNVTVSWPSGRREAWSQQPIDRWRTLTEGTGR